MENDFLIRKQIEFVNYRLGQFIHFNSATFQFNSTEMKDWEYDVENFQTARKYPFDPKDFCPDELDCAQWAEASHLLGAKFAALTTKHHEGFCLWPSIHNISLCFFITCFNRYCRRISECLPFSGY